jgi:hypothetical protein
MSREDIERLAAMAGLTIDPAHMPGVIRNLETLLAQAALLMMPPLDFDVEPAPVFRP